MCSPLQSGMSKASWQQLLQMICAAAESLMRLCVFCSKHVGPSALAQDKLFKSIGICPDLGNFDENVDFLHGESI